MATTIPDLIKDIENKTKNGFQFPTNIKISNDSKNLIWGLL